ncbi:MAG: uracil-DNA glycosylase [Pseudohongiellaceae bacterium]
MKTATETEPRIKLEESWRRLLEDEFAKPYMCNLREFLRREKKLGKVIYPPGELIFNALDSTPFDQVKVVILGQDPYHGPGQAHGLCFSVLPGVPPPPSLQNIFKELATDLNIARPKTGCLESWAHQGVLLLNAVLTVEAGRPTSHEGKGWEQFTDVVVHKLNELKSNVVFMLWGSYAQRKGGFIDAARHLVLKSPHPSPLSASRGFFGNRHFSRANGYLLAHGKSEIDWGAVGS